MKYWALTYMILVAHSVFACKCLYIDVKTAFKQFDVVVSAKVIEITEPKIDTFSNMKGETYDTQNVFGHTVKLELISIYKGKKLAKYMTIAPDESTCESYFELGKSYIVFGNLLNGYIITNQCTRTKLLNDNEDLFFLQKKIKKRKTLKVQ